MPNLRRDAGTRPSSPNCCSSWAGGLARDPDRLGASLEQFVGRPAHDPGNCGGPGPVHLPARRRRRRVPVRPGSGKSGPMTAASPLRRPASPEGGGCAAAHFPGAPRKDGPPLRPH